MIKKSLLTLCFIFLTGCDNPPDLINLDGQAQGTTYHIKFWSEQAVDKNTLHQQIEAEFARIDKLISNYRDDSDIEQFNQSQNNQPFTINEEITDLLIIAQTVNQQSLGCFDPTIQPLFKLWGFQSNQLTVPTDEAITKTLQQVDFTQLQIEAGQIIRLGSPNLTLDLSGIGQGYSVYLIAKILEKTGINNYMVEIGGEMLVKGRKPNDGDWKIAIERPTPNANKIQKLISLNSDSAVAVMTSGTYRHFFDEAGKQYSHVIDPRQGRPISHQTVSVTVLMDNPTLADAWSTALLCLGSEEGIKIVNQAKIPALFIDLENETLIEKSSDTISSSKSWEVN